jgi:hypothetical protein
MAEEARASQILDQAPADRVGILAVREAQAFLAEALGLLRQGCVPRLEERPAVVRESFHQ